MPSRLYMRPHFHLLLPVLLAIFALSVLTNCSNRPLVNDPESGLIGEDNADQQSSANRLERYNRAVYRFNQALDAKVLAPIAKGYRKFTPSPLRQGIGNFFQNLSQPLNILNSFLQGKAANGIDNLATFIFNSTIGLGGILDVSSALEIPKHDEDFGQTLAVWGLPSGPVMVMPVLGAGYTRDFAGQFIHRSYLDPLQLATSDTKLGLDLLQLINFRAQLFDLAVLEIIEMQLDPFQFYLESYRQHRHTLIHDETTLSEDSFWDDIDEDFEEDFDLDIN